MSAADEETAIVAELEKTGWTKFPRQQGDTRVCLAIGGAQAITVAATWASWYWHLDKARRELFPGRGAALFGFNDHPDTTYEDVLLVIKHAGELRKAEIGEKGNG